MKPAGLAELEVSGAGQVLTGHAQFDRLRQTPSQPRVGLNFEARVIVVFEPGAQSQPEGILEANLILDKGMALVLCSLSKGTSCRFSPGGDGGVACPALPQPRSFPLTTSTVSSAMIKTDLRPRGDICELTVGAL